MRAQEGFDFDELDEDEQRRYVRAAKVDIRVANMMVKAHEDGAVSLRDCPP
jgi:hypothetical protein